MFVILEESVQIFFRMVVVFETVFQLVLLGTEKAFQQKIFGVATSEWGSYLLAIRVEFYDLFKDVIWFPIGHDAESWVIFDHHEALF